MISEKSNTPGLLDEPHSIFVTTTKKKRHEHNRQAETHMPNISVEDEEK
jgi:hypothetical protein